MMRAATDRQATPRRQQTATRGRKYGSGGNLADSGVEVEVID